MVVFGCMNISWRLFVKTVICQAKTHNGVPVTGRYKSLFALTVCLPVMFRYIPTWHLEAEGSAQEGVLVDLWFRVHTLHTYGLGERVKQM